MSVFKDISYFADDEDRRSAKVRQNLTDKTFIVTAKNDMGSAFTCMFESVESAETFAEEWVNG